MAAEYFVGIFENDNQNPLSYLEDEYSAIDGLLLSNKDQFTKEIISNKGVDGFIDKVKELTNDMTVFHFSGHQGGGTIQLSDEVFNNKGLINILNNAPKLKMVFINGCSTDAIINSLDNVPIVIGTTTPVYDHFAKTFSERFYSLLLNEEENINSSDLIENVFLQAVGFQQGYYKDPEEKDNQRGSMAFEELNKKLDNYVIKINKEAQDFDQRVIYNQIPDAYPIYSGFKKLEQEIIKEEKLDDKLYKYYPYFLCIHLYKLSDYDNDNNSKYQKLGEERYRTTRKILNEFLKFLKFSAYSIIWSISKEHPDFSSQLSPEVKTVLRENLKISWQLNDQDRIIEDLALIYSNIPDKYIENYPFWQELKECAVENQKDFQYVSDFFFEHTDQNQSSKQQYIKAESYLRIFLKRFRFLRTLGIESIYDVFYYQFKYKSERSYFINKSFYPIDSRPLLQGFETGEVFTVTDSSTMIDINVHSVYVYKTEIKEDQLINNRAINLSPFYLDINSASVAADKIKLYYLDRYHVSGNKLIYEAVDSDNLDEENKKITVPLNPILLENQSINGNGTIKLIESKKKLLDHFKTIWEIIS
ncbi:hypothetical protein [Aquimarina sp. MMG016]|uniref:hypothetical protein n=1 Tax=Aquimarina sp. MMG016 TaxID=2822690 RepID=UPI001B39F1F0|nr:hypothetical protein [Aquimarina sp. MMG016]MBQ4819452.1 hypothetical protein [Aquimarina sp. MMG016]